MDRNLEKRIKEYQSLMEDEFKEHHKDVTETIKQVSRYYDLTFDYLLGLVLGMKYGFRDTIFNEITGRVILDEDPNDWIEKSEATYAASYRATNLNEEFYIGLSQGINQGFDIAINYLTYIDDPILPKLVDTELYKAELTRNMDIVMEYLYQQELVIPYNFEETIEMGSQEVDSFEPRAHFLICDTYPRDINLDTYRKEWPSPEPQESDPDLPIAN